MSTTKLDTSGAFQSITVQTQSTQLSLPAHTAAHRARMMVQPRLGK